MTNELKCNTQIFLSIDCLCCSGLYGPGQVFYSPCDPTDSTQLESVLLRALDTLGQIRLIVHSSANEPLQLSRQELTGDIGSVNRKLDR